MHLSCMSLVRAGMMLRAPDCGGFKTCCVVSLLFFQLKSQSLFSPLESGWVPGLLVTRSICG